LSDLRRREFITLLGGGAAAWPLAARAQQRASGSLVGILSPVSPAAAARNLEALRSGLRDLGYIEGRNLTIEARFAGGIPGRLADLAAELVAMKPTVIVAGSLVSILAVANATRTIPVVMSATSEDPVAAGLAVSLARPGGNITGFWIQGEGTLIGKRLEILKEAVPRISRVGVVVNPGDATDAGALKSLPEAARALELAVRLLEVRAVTELEAAFATAVREGMHALYVSQTPTFFTHHVKIAAMALRARLPAIDGFREFAIAGGLLSYSASLPDIYRRAAAVVDKILKGSTPADLPIERPIRFELVINLKTARALGLEIPPTLLARADEVIE
jgi:putative ABC transport system substrate-binding protein